MKRVGIGSIEYVIIAVVVVVLVTRAVNFIQGNSETELNRANLGSPAIHNAVSEEEPMGRIEKRDLADSMDRLVSTMPTFTDSNGDEYEVTEGLRTKSLSLTGDSGTVVTGFLEVTYKENNEGAAEITFNFIDDTDGSYATGGEVNALRNGLVKAYKDALLELGWLGMPRISETDTNVLIVE